MTCYVFVSVRVLCVCASVCAVHCLCARFCLSACCLCRALCACLSVRVLCLCLALSLCLSMCYACVCLSACCVCISDCLAGFYFLHTVFSACTCACPSVSVQQSLAASSVCYCAHVFVCVQWYTSLFTTCFTFSLPLLSDNRSDSRITRGKINSTLFPFVFLSEFFLSGLCVVFFSKFCSVFIAI